MWLYGQGIYTILYVRYDVSTCLCIGIYTADTTPADSKLFIGEYHALPDLLDGLKTPCSCGMSSHPWVMESVIQVCSFIYYLLTCTRITTNDVSVIAINFMYRRGMWYGCSFAVGGVISTEERGPVPVSFLAITWWTKSKHTHVRVNHTCVYVYTVTLLPLLCILRLVHSFTCAGMLQTQYIKFSLFAGFGTVKNAYIRQGGIYMYHLRCM